MIASVVTEMSGARAAAEQAVHGGDIGRDFIAQGFCDFQRAHLRTDGFCQPRRGLAGWRGETNAQRLARLYCRGLE
ncbi:hypothetical protein D3C80_1548770 [compost metagenome]